MKELTHEDWMKNPIPRMMWVWDYDIECKVVRKVVYVSSREYFPVITVDAVGNIYTFRNCAETYILIDDIVEIVEEERSKK